MELADAIKAAPILNPERRGELHGALQMAHAIIWAEAHAEEEWSSLPTRPP